MNDALHGLYSAVIATTICYPLDTLKTQLQARQPLNLRGGYRGLGSELSGAAPSSIVYWYTYGKCRQYDMSTFSASVCGAFVGNFIDTPFDIWKKQRQLKLQTELSNSLLRRFGVVNVCHSILYNSIYMPLLDTLLKKGWSKTQSIFVCCSVANIVTYPLDRVRTKLITGANLAVWYKGLGYRLLYGNLYSGLYMHLFLAFHEKI
jgi:hypothetical protein